MQVDYGLEKDLEPKDNDFYVLYFQVKLEDIIWEYFWRYFNKGLLRGELLAKKEKITQHPKEDEKKRVIENLFQQIYHLQSVQDLISCMVNNTNELEDKKFRQKLFEYFVKERIEESSLRYRCYYFRSVWYGV